MPLARKQIEYLGVDNPSTKIEVEVEISGLKNIIKQAEEKISRLEQAIKIVDLQTYQSESYDGYK